MIPSILEINNTNIVFVIEGLCRFRTRRRGVLNPSFATPSSAPHALGSEHLFVASVIYFFPCPAPPPPLAPQAVPSIYPSEQFL